MPKRQEERIENKQELLDSCCFLKLSLHRLGDKRGVDTEKITVNADKELIQVRKKIFKSASFDSIRSLDNGIRRYIRSECFPFDVGTHLCPQKKVDQVNDQLEGYMIIREERVDTFIRVFPDLGNQFKDKLRDLWESKDYSGTGDIEEDIKTQFFMDWNFWMFSAASNLESVNPKIWKQQQEKFARLIDDTWDQCRQVQREITLELVRHLRDCLEPDHLGAVKRLNSSTVQKLQGYLTSGFYLANVTNDREHENYVKELTDLMAGITSDRLKDNDELRYHVHRELQRVENILDESITVGPKRRIRFGED